MSLFKKVQTLFSSKRKKEVCLEKDIQLDENTEEASEEASDDEESPLNREDLRELERIIRASKEAFFESKKNREKNQNTQKSSHGDMSHHVYDSDKRRATRQDEDYSLGDVEEFQPIDDEELDFLESGGSRNGSANGGIAFEVDFEPKKKVKARPRERQQEAPPIKPLMEYSCTEKALMAEIIREDMLTERAHKAAQTDIKRFDASRRRMVMSADTDARAAERQNEGLSPLDETNRRLRQLALKAKEARVKAAAKKQYN